MLAEVMEMAEDMALFLVLAEFGTTQIPVERCASHFGMTGNEAKAAARRQALPVPCYRLGSQKSPWVVDASVLAAHIAERKRQAEQEWRRINSA